MSPRAVLTFFLAFSIEIHVNGAVDVPKNCSRNLESTTACSVLADKGEAKLISGSTIVRVAEGGSMRRQAEEAGKAVVYELVRGVFLIDGDGTKIKFKSLYGDLFVSTGMVLVDVTDYTISFTNISADLKYQPRGDAKTYDLPAGFATYMAKVNPNGLAEVGFPKPAEVGPLLKNWSRFYTKIESKDFESDVNQFISVWRQATSVVGPWYKDTVDREIASYEAEKARLAQEKARREAESAEYRNMLRDRILRDFQDVPPEFGQSDE